MDSESIIIGNEWVERVKEYLIQRRYLGITVWSSRHPSVNDYIQRVFDNAHLMLERKLVDKVVIAVDGTDGKPMDHITIKCCMIKNSEDHAHISDYARSILEEEFRATILRLGMLDQQMSKVHEDATWKIMIVSSAPTSTEERAVMHSNLVGGQWFVDNNKLQEQVSLAHRVDSGRIPRLLPIKSYRDEIFNLTSYANIFNFSREICANSSQLGTNVDPNSARRSFPNDEKSEVSHEL